MASRGNARKKKPFYRRAGAWVAACLGAGVIAAVVAFGTSLGSRAGNELGASSPSPISSSAQEIDWECGTSTYLPERESRKVLEEGPPSRWETIQARPGAVFAGTDIVEVSIRGTSMRTITVTGIKFDVDRYRPRPGATFAMGCGDGTYGYSLEVDLDAAPPRIVQSSGEPEGVLGAERNGHPITRPIRFPWTVSVTDSLLLYIRATTKSCHCTWRAELPWVSGAERGVIKVDNGGSGYEVIASPHLKSYSPAYGRWVG